MYVLLTIIFNTISFIHCALILNHDTTWIDDFQYDSLGQAGWNIRQISGYSIPMTNPTVMISNIPKYHGPFPSSYAIERHISCNTTHNSRLFVSLLTSYCNTDKRDDEISFTIIENTSNTFTMQYYQIHKLYSQKQKLFNRNDLPFMQTTTANYYTNHSSSTTIIPQCATNTIEWYTSNIYRSYQLQILGNQQYKITIIISLTDKDKYVSISNIALLCIQTPSFNPTIDKPEYTGTANKYEIFDTTDTITSTINQARNTNNSAGNPQHNLLTTEHVIDTNISNSYTSKNISNLPSTDVLLYIAQIFSAISFCCVCACVAACISVHINNKLNALKVVEKIQKTDKEKDIIQLMTPLQLIATIQPEMDYMTDSSDLECRIIKVFNKDNSNAASVDVKCNEMIEGNPKKVNNESFRVGNNKIIDCNSMNQKEINYNITKEDVEKYNDNACSEMGNHEFHLNFYNNEGNEFNDDAASDDELNTTFDITSS